MTPGSVEHVPATCPSPQTASQATIDNASLLAAKGSKANNHADAVQDTVITDDFELEFDQKQELPTAAANPDINHVVHSIDVTTGTDATTSSSSQQAAPLSSTAEPAPITFDGEGLKEVGSARKADAADDDEFDYAFEGGGREGEVHKRVFKNQAMPAHLVTNVKQRLTHDVVEEDEEEAEEKEEEVVGEKRGSPLAIGAAAAAPQQPVVGLHLSHASGRASATPALLSAGEEAALVEAAFTHMTEAAKARTLLTSQAVDAAAVSGEDAGTAAPPVNLASMGHAAAVAALGMQNAVAHQLDATVAAAPNTSASAVMHCHPMVAPSAATLTSTPASAVATAATQVMAVAATPAAAATAASPADITPTEQRTSGAGATPSSGSAPPVESSAGVALSSGPAGLLMPGNGDSLPAAVTGSSRTAGTSKGRRPRPKGSTSQRKSPPLVPSPFAALSTDEWDFANAAHEEEVAHAKGAVVPADKVLLVSYQDAYKHFMQLDLSHRHKEVAATLSGPPSALARLCCMAPPELAANLRPEQLHLLSLAKLPYREDEPMHFQLLASAFVAFTGQAHMPARFGSDWAKLGFQGTDPATDLRAAGVLGLLHLYCLHHHSASNAAKLYHLSTSTEQEFPLAIVSLNVSKWVLQMVRQGQLTTLANEINSMFEAASKTYIGTMYEFYRTWTGGKKTMDDSGHVLKQLEARAKKRPMDMARAAEQTLV